MHVYIHFYTTYNLYTYVHVYVCICITGDGVGTASSGQADEPVTNMSM